MYSFPYLEPVPYSMSSSNCCFLTHIQFSQEVGKVVWYSILLKNFPQFIMIHTVKGFGIVNKAEVDIFFWNSLSFSVIQWMVAIWYLAPLPFLNPSWTSGGSWFTYCWHLAWRVFEHTLSSMWNDRICTVVWTFFGIALLWDWNENGPFPALWPPLSCPNLQTYRVQHFLWLVAICFPSPSVHWRCILQELHL